MKILAIALAAMLVPAAAQAANNFSTTRLDLGNQTCAEVHDIIARDGAVVIHYRSARTGRALYDRYIADARFCQAYNYAEQTYIPTSDNSSCPVLRCERDNNSPLFNH